MFDDENLVCDGCGEQSADVSETLCPYAQDVHNTEIEATLCSKCYTQRCEDI